MVAWDHIKKLIPHCLRLEHLFLYEVQQLQQCLQHLRISFHRTSTGPLAQGITEILNEMEITNLLSMLKLLNIHAIIRTSNKLSA